jgi:hypothetical protein
MPSNDDIGKTMRDIRSLVTSEYEDLRECRWQIEVMKTALELIRDLPPDAPDALGICKGIAKGAIESVIGGRPKD